MKEADTASSHRKRAPRRHLIIAIAVVSVLASVLLGWRWLDAKGSVATVRIAFVGTLSPDGRPLVTGVGARVVEEGFLESELRKRAIALQWVPMPHAAVGPMTNEAFANHGIDFASYSELPSIIANANGIHTKLVVPTGRGGDTFLVVPAGSEAVTLGDLKGAVHKGRPWELPFLRLLDSAGLTYDDFNVMNLNPEVGVAALSASKIDALVITTQAYLLEQKGIGRILWSTVDRPVEWKTLGGIWAAADFVDHHPDLTQLVTTAFVRAHHWASLGENRAQVIAQTARAGTPTSAIEREYSDGSLSWKERWSPVFDDSLYDHYRSAIALAVAKKVIPAPFDFRDSADDRFVRRALADLGLEGGARLPFAFANQSLFENHLGTSLLRRRT